MNRALSGAAAALSVWLLPTLAQAQPALGGYQRPQVNPYPTVSPYLNLSRGAGGVNTAIDYYGIVRPQQDFRGNVVNLQQQLQGLQQAQQAPHGNEADQSAFITGRPIGGFMNYGHFFPQLTPGAGGNRPAPTGSAGRR